MDEVIQVRAMAEFIHQDYFTLIGSGAAHKHGCTLVHTKYGFYHNFFSKYMFEVKKLKTCSGKWLKLWSNFFTLIPISWCDQFNERVNKLTRRKPYMGQNFLCVNVRVQQI